MNYRGTAGTANQSNIDLMGIIPQLSVCSSGKEEVGLKIALVGEATLEYIGAALFKMLGDLNKSIAEVNVLSAYTWRDENVREKICNYDVVVVIPYPRAFTDLYGGEDNVISSAYSQLTLFGEFVTVLSKLNNHVILFTPPKTSETLNEIIVNDYDKEAINVKFKSDFIRIFNNNILVDLDVCISSIGINNFFDNKNWSRSKLLCSTKAAGIVAHGIIQAIYQSKEWTARVLLVDFDNTLWSGTIGDDGSQGVKVGKNDGPVAEKHFKLQNLIKQYKDRGVILIGLTKNDPGIIDEEFDKIPGGVLKRSDFLSIHSSWRNKSDSIEIIKEVTNVGTSSMLLLDDNEFERAEISDKYQDLPCFNISFDDYSIDRELASSVYTAYKPPTKEDFQRIESLRSRRILLESETTTTGDFLKKLNMTAKIVSIDEDNIKRVSQMLAKTNQFEMTGVRLSVEQLRDPNYKSIIASLKDNLADHGIVAAIIYRADRKELIIDNWVMSCRVFGRGLEYFMMQKLLLQAKRAGFDRIALTFKKTDRNQPALNFLGKFMKLENVFKIDEAEACLTDIPIAIGDA